MLEADECTTPSGSSGTLCPELDVKEIRGSKSFGRRNNRSFSVSMTGAAGGGGASVGNVVGMTGVSSGNVVSTTIGAGGSSGYHGRSMPLPYVGGPSVPQVPAYPMHSASGSAAPLALLGSFLGQQSSGGEGRRGLSKGRMMRAIQRSVSMQERLNALVAKAKKHVEQRRER